MRSAHVAVLLVLGSILAADAAQDPGVLPLGSNPYGKSYGDWVVAYWQWALSIPFANNPWANDPTGAYAASGQSGPVWFLGGSLGASASRNVTIPVGKAVFLPIHQWIFGATVGDCDPTNPGTPCDVPTLKTAAANAADAVVLMQVSIDGRSIADVSSYRIAPPSSFSVTVPEDNVPAALGLTLAAGTYSPQVADGYYMLLAPLSAGQHIISVHVISPLVGEYTISYSITVR